MLVVPHVQPVLSAGSQHDDVLGEEGSESENSNSKEEVHAKEENVGPLPFLKKTFEMVEDPNTDPIVSWGKTRDSFVVWDCHKFSKTILPKYFKHSNFSSFIRQLNTYGFRKVDSDRWEFANEGFKGGRKHLLKHIKRRSKYNKLHQSGAALNYSMKPCLEGEVEQLKKEQNTLKVEILKLTQQHEALQIQLTNVEERVRYAELKQFQVFLKRMVKNPAFIEQLICRVKGKGELDGAVTVKRRRRLLETHCPLSFPKGTDTTPDFATRHQGFEQLVTLQSKLNELLFEPVDEGVEVSDSNIYLELKDLISKQAEIGLAGQTR